MTQQREGTTHTGFGKEDQPVYFSRHAVGGYRTLSKDLKILKNLQDPRVRPEPLDVAVKCMASSEWDEVWALMDTYAKNPPLQESGGCGTV